MAKARIPNGWARVKTVGEVEPIDILVNRTSGKFGTMAVNSTDDRHNPVKEHETLAAAEEFVKAMMSSGAEQLLYADQSYGDEPARLKPIMLRRAGRQWIKLDGTYWPSHRTVFVYDQAAVEENERMIAEHAAKRQELRAIRERNGELLQRLAIALPTD